MIIILIIILICGEYYYFTHIKDAAEAISFLNTNFLTLSRVTCVFLSIYLKKFY